VFFVTAGTFALRSSGAADRTRPGLDPRPASRGADRSPFRGGLRKGLRRPRVGDADPAHRAGAGLDYLRAGDTLVITKLDRPSRSVRNLNALADELQSRQVGLRALVGHDQAWYVTGRRPAGQIKAKHSRTRARAGGWTSGRAS